MNYNTSTTRTRISSINKPPVVKKQTLQTRSPSTSRIGQMLATSGASNRPLGNGTYQTTYNLTRPKFGSSMNNLDYIPPSPAQQYGTRFKNNSYSLNTAIATTANSSAPSFYNGYRSNGATPSFSGGGGGHYSSSDSSTNTTTTTNTTESKPYTNSSSKAFNTSLSSSYSSSTSAFVTSTNTTTSNSSSGSNGYKHNYFDTTTAGNGKMSNSTVGNSLENNNKTTGNNNFHSNKGLVGLANLGNTCFMNSVLQCLSNCRVLQEFCTTGRYEEDLNPNSRTKGNLFKTFADLIRLMWKSESDHYVSPDKFRRTFQKIAPSFHGTAQQDSQEFLRIMLEGLHQDVNRVHQRPKPLKINEEEDEKLPDKELAETYWSRYLRLDNSFMVDLFVGQLKSTLMCKRCGYKSITFDPFWDLSLPIPKVRRTNTLNDCLELFTSEEILDGDEMPKCSKCRQKRPCSKSFSIQKFPQMLVIHLKRFSGDRYRSKISAFIDFPITNLDLSRFTADTCQQRRVSYNLYGVSNHSGTVHGGHYTAYCSNPYSHNWYEFNDTRVSRINDSSVVSSEAYVLFYQLS